MGNVKSIRLLLIKTCSAAFIFKMLSGMMDDSTTTSADIFFDTNLTMARTIYLSLIKPLWIWSFLPNSYCGVTSQYKFDIRKNIIWLVGPRLSFCTSVSLKNSCRMADIITTIFCKQTDTHGVEKVAQYLRNWFKKSEFEKM